MHTMFVLKKQFLVWICGLLFCSGSLQSLTAQSLVEAVLPAELDINFQAPATIRVSSNLVSVPVSVTDTAGQAVKNLEIGDFKVEEDGDPVLISKIAEANESPLNLALLFDLSGSVKSRFEFEQQAAIRFLEKVWKPGDTISLIAFSDQPEIRLRGSKSPEEAMQEILKLAPTPYSTAFFDTVIAAARLLYQSEAQGTRQAMVVLSDGSDNRSDRSLVEALQEVQRSDTIFYSINPSGASVRLNEINLTGQGNLVTLATETGGAAFVSESTADLTGIFNRIATELQAQYLLSYYSPNARLNGKFRKIKAIIPKRPDLRIRARQGYYAVNK
jgi:Ca-activated chloride channel homolog